MRQLSSTLMLLALMEEAISLGMIWNQPAATWHTVFMAGRCLPQEHCCTYGRSNTGW
jgi:hypothetical protein